MKNQSFCVLPWLHSAIEADGRVFPCCLSTRTDSPGHLHTDTLEDIYSSESYKKIRQAMLEGSEVASCTHCYNIEKCGGLSLRQSSNEEFKSHIPSLIKNTNPDGSLKNDSIVSFDLRFSNVCNFSCRTCGPNSSTSWYEDFNHLSTNRSFKKILRPTKTREEFWTLLDKYLPTLEKIYIAGGEPLLEADHYLMLDKLIALGNTNLSLNYNTNFSAIKLGDKNIFDYWKHFKNVNVFLSYDGFGPKGELIRKGMNWNKVQDNHRELLNHPEINFFITPTISVLNAFHMPEFIEHLISEKLINDGSQVGFNIVHDPLLYNISIFNADEKSALHNLYENFIATTLPKYSIPNTENLIQQLRMVLDYKLPLENTLNLRKKFLMQTVTLDKVRGEKALKLFPELLGFYQ